MLNQYWKNRSMLREIPSVAVLPGEKAEKEKTKLCGADSKFPAWA